MILKSVPWIMIFSRFYEPNQKLNYDGKLDLVKGVLNVLHIRKRDGDIPAQRCAGGVGAGSIFDDDGSPSRRG